MIKVLETAGILAAALIMAAIDFPKFEYMEEGAKHKAVFFTILALFVLLSVAQIWIRAQ